MTLTVLLDRDDVRTVERQSPDALAGHVIAWDLPAYLELRSLGRAPLTPWDFVTAGDLPAARAFEQRIQTFWQRHARIDHHGIDLLAVAGFRHVACLARMAWTAYVIRRALIQLAPNTVYVLDDPPGHGLEQPPGHTHMPVLQPLVRGLAESLGMPVELTPAGRADFHDAAADQTRWTDAQPVCLRHALGDQPFMLFAGDGADLLRQLPLITAMRANDDVAVIQTYRAADEAALRALRAAGHLVYHESQIAPPANQGEDADLRTALNAARADFRSACDFADPEVRDILANPHLCAHVDFVLGDYARRMAAHLDRWLSFCDRHAPRAVVANYPLPVMDVAAHLGIPCLLLSHGVMTACDPRWYACLPSITIGAASRAHALRLADAGVASERIRLTGDPGLIAAPRAAASNTRRRSATPKRRILLVTSAIAAPAHQSDLPQIHWPRAITTFVELSALASRRTDWQFTIKPHPRYDQVELYEQLACEHPPDRRWCIDDHSALPTLVQSADAVVIVNNRSSALVEASLHGIPVYLLNGDMVGVDWSAWRLNTWPQLAGVVELEQELAAIFANEKRYIRRSDQTTRAVRHFLGDDAPPNLDCAVDALNDLVGLAETAAKPA